MSGSWFKPKKKVESVQEQMDRIKKENDDASNEVTRCTESAIFDLNTLRELKVPDPKESA